MREVPSPPERLSTPVRPWEAGKALQAPPDTDSTDPPPLVLLTRRKGRLPQAAGAHGRAGAPRRAPRCLATRAPPPPPVGQAQRRRQLAKIRRAPLAREAGRGGAAQGRAGCGLSASPWAPGARAGRQGPGVSRFSPAAAGGGRWLGGGAGAFLAVAAAVAARWAAGRERSLGSPRRRGPPLRGPRPLSRRRLQGWCLPRPQALPSSRGGAEAGGSSRPVLMALGGRGGSARASCRPGLRGEEHLRAWPGAAGPAAGKSGPGSALSLQLRALDP